MSKRLLQLSLGFAAATLCATAAAQAYPTQPVTWTITDAGGGAFDTLSRALAPAMSADLGQPLIVENRPGGSGTIALGHVARAKPDGYTVLTAGVSQLVLGPFFVKATYDTRKDFQPVGLIGDLPFALYVHHSLEGVTTLKEFIEYTKKKKVFYGTHGVGSSFHLAFEIMRMRTGADIQHVAYKGTAPARVDLAAGRVQAMFGPPSGDTLGFIAKGTLRALASVSEKRLPELPNVPTFDEAGVQNLGVSGWSGFLAPAGTPREIVLRLNRALNKAADSELAQKAYRIRSMVQKNSTPDQMAERIETEIRFWQQTLPQLGIKPKSCTICL